LAPTLGWFKAAPEFRGATALVKWFVIAATPDTIEDDLICAGDLTVCDRLSGEAFFLAIANGEQLVSNDFGGFLCPATRELAGLSGSRRGR
jgi:hypothetical protein